MICHGEIVLPKKLYSKKKVESSTYKIYTKAVYAVFAVVVLHII